MAFENDNGGSGLSIQEMLRMLVGAEHAYSVVAKVTAVNGLKCNCTPLDDNDADLLNVRLIADETTEQFVLIPAVNSYVIVSFISKSDAFVSMVSKVSRLHYKINNVEVELKDAPLLFKRGENSLGSLMQKLIDEVIKIYAPKDDASLALLKVDFQNLLS